MHQQHAPAASKQAASKAENTSSKEASRQAGTSGKHQRQATNKLTGCAIHTQLLLALVWAPHFFSAEADARVCLRIVMMGPYVYDPDPYQGALTLAVTMELRPARC